MIRKKKIKIPIYDRSLVILVTDNIIEGINSIGIETEKEDESLEASVLECPKGIIHVIVPPDVSIGTIAHESFHVVVSLLDDAGCKLTESSEEAYAYLLGYVSEQIYTFILKCKNN